MKRWAIYDTTGAIKRIYNGSESEAKIQLNGEEQLLLIDVGVNDSENYVLEGKIKERSTIKESVTVSSQMVYIKNIPKGTLVQCESESEQTSGTTTIEVDEPGTYTIYLKPPVAYKPKTIEVEIP